VGQSWGVGGQEESAGHRKRKKTSNNGAEYGVILDYPIKLKLVFLFFFLAWRTDLNFYGMMFSLILLFFLGNFFLSH